MLITVELTSKCISLSCTAINIGRKDIIHSIPKVWGLFSDLKSWKLPKTNLKAFSCISRNESA